MIPFAKLSLARVNVIGVPRTSTGPNLEALAQLARLHGPRMFFTPSLCQTPTGSSLDLPTAHGILQLAQQFGFAVVDNDPLIDLPDVAGCGLGSWISSARSSRSGPVPSCCRPRWTRWISCAGGPPMASSLPPAGCFG